MISKIRFYPLVRRGQRLRWEKDLLRKVIKLPSFLQNIQGVKIDMRTECFINILELEQIILELIIFFIYFIFQ